MKKQVHHTLSMNAINLDLGYLIHKLSELEPIDASSVAEVLITRENNLVRFRVTHCIDMTGDEIARHYDKLAKAKLRERESKTIQYYKLKQELEL
jgi:hypothetical protein